MLSILIVFDALVALPAASNAVAVIVVVPSAPAVVLKSPPNGAGGR